MKTKMNIFFHFLIIYWKIKKPIQNLVNIYADAIFALLFPEKT